MQLTTVNTHFIETEKKKGGGDAVTCWHCMVWQRNMELRMGVCRSPHKHIFNFSTLSFQRKNSIQFFPPSCSELKAKKGLMGYSSSGAGMEEKVCRCLGLSSCTRALPWCIYILCTVHVEGFTVCSPILSMCVAIVNAYKIRL